MYRYYSPVAQKKRNQAEKAGKTSASPSQDGSRAAPPPHLTRPAISEPGPKKDRSRRKRGNLTKRQHLVKHQQTREGKSSSQQRVCWASTETATPHIKTSHQGQAPGNRGRKTASHSCVHSKSKPAAKKVMGDSARKSKSSVGTGSRSSTAANSAASNSSNNRRENACLSSSRCIDAGAHAQGPNQCRRKPKVVAFHTQAYLNGRQGCRGSPITGRTQPQRAAPHKKVMVVGGSVSPTSCQTQGCCRPSCRLAAPNASHTSGHQFDTCGKVCPRSQSARPCTKGRHGPVKIKSEPFKCSSLSNLTPNVKPWLRAGSKDILSKVNDKPGFVSPRDSPCQRGGDVSLCWHPKLPKGSRHTGRDPAGTKSMVNTRPKSGILKKSSSKFDTLRDPVEQCSRALSSIKLKEAELLEKYGPSSSSESTCDYSPRWRDIGAQTRWFEPGLAWGRGLESMSSTAVSFDHDWSSKPWSCDQLRGRTRDFSNNRYSYMAGRSGCDAAGFDSLSRFYPSRTTSSNWLSARPSSVSLSSQHSSYKTTGPRAELRLMNKYLLDDCEEMGQGQDKPRLSPSRKMKDSSLDTNTCQSKSEGVARSVTPPWRKVDGASGCPGFVLDPTPKGVAGWSGCHHKQVPGWRRASANTGPGVTDTPHKEHASPGAGVGGAGETTPDGKCSSSHNGFSSLNRVITDTGLYTLGLSKSFGPAAAISCTSTRACGSGGGGARRVSEWQGLPTCKPTLMESCLKEEEERLLRVGSIIG